MRPTNVAGSVNISRLGNIRFEDTSSREGLQQNEVFSLFKEVLLSLIGEFEYDRSYLAREFSTYYDEVHSEIVSPEAAKELLERIALKAKSKTPTEKKTDDDREKELLARLVTQKVEEIEELRNEQQLLRVLASNALTIASFTHELRNIEKNLVNRIDETTAEFRKLISIERCELLADHLNPFVMLADLRNEDIKLKEWLSYSLGTLRKDKRRRRNIELNQYFQNLQNTWQAACRTRGIEFVLALPAADVIKMRAFEVDLDCIFNNLITNSFEAFSRKDAPFVRRIFIRVTVQLSDLSIEYSDSGPGLSTDIADPERIFEPHFTTKKDPHTGEDVGTGLGMWLVKSFVEDNKGTVTLILDRPGFALTFLFPNKLKTRQI